MPEGDLLRSVIDTLAVIPRLPTSDGERRAAEWLHGQFEAYGCRTEIEQVPAYPSYATPIGLMSAAAAAGAWAGGRGHRLLGSVVAGLAAAGIVDDIDGGRNVFRRLFLRARTAYNVVAVTGDPAATRTLVVLAHHDAAPSGLVFDSTVNDWVAKHRPDLIEAMTSNPPLWWPVIAGPALACAGSALGSAGLRRVGLALSLASAAAMADVASRGPVPGANDNLSGVAALVAVARALQAAPVRGLRVMLVSAGAEEAIQQGIRGFAERHFDALPRHSTTFVNLDTVGSGRLVLLEGEGPVRMQDYDRESTELVARCADAVGVPLLRGLRSRNSTDGSVPLRHGYPTATLVSVDDRKLLPHYHLDTDLPENVDVDCVAGAARLVEAVARRLAAPPQ